MKECKKTKFATEILANEYIDKLIKTSIRKEKPCRSYLCEHCLTWHLTSIKNKNWNPEIKRLKRVVQDQQTIICRQKKIIENLKIELGIKIEK